MSGLWTFIYIGYEILCLYLVRYFGTHVFDNKSFLNQSIKKCLIKFHLWSQEYTLSLSSLSPSSQNSKMLKGHKLTLILDKIAFETKKKKV